MGRRWIAPEWGAPESWLLVPYDASAPIAGEVTIRVAASGVNPADAKHVAVPRPGVRLPVAPGYEVSGVLTAIGPGTAIGSGAASVGDEVVAFRISGGYASEVTVPAADVFAKPRALTHPEAANLLLVGSTAAEMLDVTGVRAGESILLHGASGAVGVSVLQQAALRGARVVGTASPDRFDVVRGFGGIPVAYGSSLEERVREVAPSPVVAALDAVGTAEAVDVSLALVADRSRIVTIAAAGRASAEGFVAIAGAMPASAAYRDAARQSLLDLASAGSLRVPVARTFPLEEALDALRLLATGHPGGKLALVP